MQLCRFGYAEKIMPEAKYANFEKGDTICGAFDFPNTIKCVETWDENDFATYTEFVDKAKKLDEKFCSAIHQDDGTVKVREWFIEALDVDENGNVLEKFGFDFAEGRYIVDFGTGAGSETAYSVEDAMKKAEAGIAYTQKDIRILDETERSPWSTDPEPVVAILPWYGVKADEDDEVVQGFGEYGFYGPWQKLDN